IFDNSKSRNHAYIFRHAWQKLRRDLQRPQGPAMFTSFNSRASIPAALFGAAILTLAGYALLDEGVSQAEPTEPMPVVVRPTTSRQVTDWAEYSGRLEAVERVEIRPRVAGTLLAVHFRDGQLVRKGDLLFTL